MQHEHHGNCCHEPHDADEHLRHEHIALPLGQLCCAGACQHPEHQHLLARQMMHDMQEDIETTFTKKKKKKQRLLGMYGLELAV